MCVCVRHHTHYAVVADHKKMGFHHHHHLSDGDATDLVTVDL